MMINILKLLKKLSIGYPNVRIVSKNSHRIWCIVKVQSVVRRWLAIRLLKKLKLEKQQREQQVLEIKQLELTPTISAVIGAHKLQQQQLPDQIDLNPVGDEFNPNLIVGETSSDEESDQNDKSTTSITSSTNNTEELKPIEDELLKRSFEKLEMHNNVNLTREQHSLSIDLMSEESTPHPSRSSSMSSCISSSSASSSPAAIESISNSAGTKQSAAVSITPSISSPSLLENTTSTTSSNNDNNENNKPTITITKPATPTTTTNTSSSSPPTSRRTKTIDEMVHVEKGYVSDMNTIIDVFYQPLKDSNLLTDENLYILFSNIHELRDVHTKLLSQFENSLKNWKDESTIGDIFLPFMGDFQKLYEVYINNYEKAFAYTKYLKTNSNCATVYKKILSGECNDRCRNLDFGSFIVMPVQRLPRYIIFLKEIEKFTAPDHPDTNMAALALCQLHDLTLYLNESKRTSSDADKIAEIKSIISGADDLIGGSKYIMEGQLSLLKGMVASTKKDLFVYLFKEYFQNSFQVVTSKKVYTFVAPSTELKDKWMSALIDCQQCITPPPTPSPRSSRRSVQVASQNPLSPQWKK
ncbi:pleckstrin domain-containing protein [Heterostelium album PN500]|uniref:Pleckstrin domain-containing protein n=1 Tax=Heterostelium pallidum (strain ATCC 26659 / Pp 5 / PN500) TaxID=670386 RepID=D3B2H6_HETP5|nr:pleckstrin domain-containing protein [Heterostelium album PN500]EFA83524.1 pleckstrin domain-containing protein [Heterostelium album PN500]|eukprot:XP_020435641.1 pleckstrin domain-containing protein [Heterostelium album PN500]